MKTAKLFFSLTVFFSSVLLAGDKEDIIKQIMASNDYVNKNKTNMSEYSKDGALEFWSSGGLLHEVGPVSYTHLTLPTICSV